MFIHALWDSALFPTYCDSRSNLVPQLLLLFESIVFRDNSIITLASLLFVSSHGIR